MRALSEAISTLIIAAAIIASSLLVFYMSLALINNQMALSEYGYIKSIFIEIANNYHLILQGNSYISTKPHRFVGIGYNISDNIDMIIKYNTTTPDYIRYIKILVEKADPSDTAYSGEYYYITRIYLYLVNGEILEVHWKLDDNYGLTEPAPTIIEYIYYSNGTTIQLFDTSNNNVTPLVPLPYSAILYPGDKILVRMNENYNDNDYDDGTFPVQFTREGFKSYESFSEDGWFWFFHNTSIVITNIDTKVSGEISHYKPLFFDVQYNIDYVKLLFESSIVYSITDSSGTVTGTINNIHTELFHIDVVDSAPATIVATIHKPFVTAKRIVYGNSTSNGYCGLIVNDIRLIPCIYEFYKNGATYLVFDTQRFYVTVYKLSNGTETSYIVRIIYVVNKPLLIGSGQTSIKIIPYKDIQYRKTTINYLELIKYNHASGETLSKRIQLPSSSATLIYIVKQVNVVIT